MNCYDSSIIKTFVQILNKDKNLGKLDNNHKLGILWTFQKLELNIDFPKMYEEV